MPKKRSSQTRLVLPVFRIFCEGEKTEPLYIKGYIKHFHPEKRNLIVVENSNKNTPIQLVDAAIDAKKDGNNGDIVWVVFDRESETKYSHELHAKARHKANTHNIEIAFSNVCFEYWLLLHFTYTTAAYSSCEHLLKRSVFKKKLNEAGISDYEKGFANLFDTLKDYIPNAFENADRLKKQAVSTANPGRLAPHYLNPYVDTHEMFIDIQNFIEKTPSIRSL